MDISNIQQELHLRDYMYVLRCRRGIAVLFFITTVFVVTAASFVITPVYRATVTLLIDTESPNVLTTSGMVALESQNYYSYKEYYQSQQEILTSQSIVRRVFEEFNLTQSDDYKKVKEPIKKFLKTIKVESIRDTRLLNLHVGNKNPALAAKIANRIAEIYVRRNLYYISKDELTNLLKNEYLKLETKLSEYTKVYKDKHPKMIRLKEEMAEMAGKIDRAKKSVFEYDIGRDESIRDLDEDYLYALEGFKANNVSVQDPAEEPIVPIRPKKLINIFLSLLVGFFGGIGLAFFFEYLDDTVKEIDDIERTVEWPFLGNIPKIDTGAKLSEFEKDIITHTKPKDPVSEAYRAIRTSVLFSSTEERPLRSMIVTSPGPQEGKTITLCNLGIALSQTGKKVLLVDADMRRPRLHEVFKKENETGLSSFLSGQSGFDGLIQKTNIENLCLICGGPHPPNPSELLASHRMKDFIKAAKEKFDFILFDTPPAAVVTDAVVLSRATDGIIMVIESGKTSKKALPRIYRLIEDTKARVIGILLNRLSLTSRDYYYHSYYYGKVK